MSSGSEKGGKESINFGPYNYYAAAAVAGPVTEPQYVVAVLF